MTAPPFQRRIGGHIKFPLNACGDIDKGQFPGNLSQDLGWCSTSSSLAMFAAIRRASSLVSNLAADRRPRLFLEIGVGQLLTVAVP